MTQKRNSADLAKGQSADSVEDRPTPASRPRRAPPMFNSQELRTRLRAYDRTPFLDVLALFLECTPDEASIRAFAERSPEKFVTSLATLGGVAGFTQKTEIHNSVNVNVSRMSDSQIEDKLDELMAELKMQRNEALNAEQPIDIEAETVSLPQGDGND